MKLLFVTSLSLFVSAATSTCNFGNDFKVLATLNSNQEFRGSSLNNNGASMYVVDDGKLVAKYNEGDEPVFASTCHCVGCTNYEFKVQGSDAHLLVLPSGGVNADYLYKTNQGTNNNDQVTVGVGQNSAKIYKGCTLVWDSAQHANSGSCDIPTTTTTPPTTTPPTGCLDGIKVITTSLAPDGESEYLGDGNDASLLLHDDGNFKCKNGNDIVYESRCACQNNNRFLRELTECSDYDYGIKFQNDGNLIVRKDNNELWKTNKRSDNEGEYAIVINDNKCQIWLLDNGCPSSLLWDSGNSDDTDDVQCSGHEI